MRRGFERYAPEGGYDPGSLARTKLAELVVRKAGLFPGDWVLDVETGTGILGVNVARAFTRAKVVVTDAERANLTTAAANAKAEGCDARLRLIQCLPDALPIKEETFFFSTAGLSLAMTEAPLDVVEEIHRVTGFYGKVYFVAADLRKLKKRPKGMEPWIFDEESVEEMRAIGFGKVQTQQIAVLADGARIQLVMAKRFDPEEGDEEDDDDGLED